MNLPKAKKQLGQHFLKDEKVIKGITNDEWGKESDIIIEVGPGPAILTKYLSLKEKPLFIIEKDLSFKEYLSSLVKEECCFYTDALEFDWDNFIIENKFEHKKIWLVSNLPYNVGTVLFTQFINIPQIKFMTLMFQKEVGDKTYVQEHSLQMNGLHFLSLNYFESKRLLKVLPGSFTPPPKVDSVVVSFRRKTAPDIELKDYRKLNQFTRNLFGMKRKQIGGVLKSFFNGDIEKLLFEAKIERTRRAETLEYKEVLTLFQKINSP